MNEDYYPSADLWLPNNPLIIQVNYTLFKRLKGLHCLSKSWQLSIIAVQFSDFFQVTVNILLTQLYLHRKTYQMGSLVMDGSELLHI